MIKEFFKNLYYTEISKVNRGKRLNLLFTLSKLSLKAFFQRKGSKKVSEVFFGHRIISYEYSSLLFLYREIFCSGDYYFKTKNSKPLIIDCGANVGAATIYFKTLFPEAAIICFEANPIIYNLLEENINNNKLINIEMHNIALYDTDKKISFFISDTKGTLMGSVRPDRDGRKEIQVQAKKLSDYIRKIDFIDLIKIDVEGAEVNIIDDLEQAELLNKPDQYIVEYHHNINDSPSSLSSILAKFELCGYNYVIKANYSKINSFQDILIHFYRNQGIE
jgi:FkbM family methyltransferase